MNARTDFSPIPVGKVAPAPTHIPAPCPSTAVMHAGADDMLDYSEQFITVTSADTALAVSDLYAQGDLSDYAHSELTRLELQYARNRAARRPAPTPQGKWIAVAMDATAALYEIVSRIRATEDYDKFSEVDVDKWAAICRRAGYALEVSHG